MNVGPLGSRLRFEAVEGICDLNRHVMEYAARGTAVILRGSLRALGMMLTVENEAFIIGVRNEGVVVENGEGKITRGYI